MSGRNVRWPRQLVCRRDRQTDGHQTVALCFDAAIA